MITLMLLAGLWSTTCIQTQINGNQGYVIESYSFEATGAFQFERQWFQDSQCSSYESSDKEEGKVKLGKMISGMFIQTPTIEADFTQGRAADYGVISLKNDDTLKVARGFINSSMRNTMTSLFEYARQ